MSTRERFQSQTVTFQAFSAVSASVYRMDLAHMLNMRWGEGGQDSSLINHTLFLNNYWCNLLLNNRLGVFFMNHGLCVFLTNHGTLKLFLNDFFLLLMNNWFLNVMNNFFVLFMDDWLVNLSDFFLVNNRLVVFVNYVLVLLMHDVFMVFMNNILMMFMNNFFMVFLNDRLVNMGFYLNRQYFFLNLSRNTVGFKDGFLFMLDDSGCLLVGSLNNWDALSNHSSISLHSS